MSRAFDDACPRCGEAAWMARGFARGDGRSLVDMTGVGKIDVTTRAQGATQLLAVGGEVDVATAGVLAREIQAALARNAETVVVDLSAVALFAVEGVRVLLDADRRARARGCRLVVIAGAGAARRVLLATDAKRWLPIAT